MDRRTLLATGVAGAIALAGCSTGSPDEPTDGRDSNPTLAEHVVSDAPPTPDVEWSGLDTQGLYLASADAAARYFHVSNTPLVAATEFEAGERLCYVRVFASQTCYRLVLDGPPAIDDEGRAVVSVRTERTAPESQACGEAMTPVGMLVRLVFDPDGPAAERVEVVVDGEETVTLDAMA
ncbi:hypothetical protein [Halococcoides cellulosivorans]|uniref:Uncharacterized protein n=1 Tax=Halococcoides cellulosivorans TaxID=1679096 RepID=A0A2R4WZ80_9EURY|nr:hypothetical protein [Halococcoides cellulosivorans]AWB26853.1 hypothetical protein HARCEL1_03540 [Halococcoides cellulosivorans]